MKLKQCSHLFFLCISLCILSISIGHTQTDLSFDCVEEFSNGSGLSSTPFYENGNRVRHIPAGFNLLAHPGEMILFTAIVEDFDATRKICNGSGNEWASISGIPPYKVRFYIVGEGASFPNGETELEFIINEDDIEMIESGNGFISSFKTDQALVNISENWSGNQIIVGFDFIDEAPNPEPPNIGHTRDEIETREFKIDLSEGPCPLTLTANPFQIGSWNYTNPDDGGYSLELTAGPDVSNDNIPDYVGQVIIETFGSIIPDFIMEDVNSEWIANMATMGFLFDTPSMIADYFFANIAASGTFIIGNNDKFDDIFNLVISDEMEFAFDFENAGTEYVGYHRKQMYLCTGDEIRSHDLFFRFDSSYLTEVKIEE